MSMTHKCYAMFFALFVLKMWELIKSKKSNSLIVLTAMWDIRCTRLTLHHFVDCVAVGTKGWVINDARWLANPTCNLRVTDHDVTSGLLGDDIISLPVAGSLRTPGYWWRHDLVPICQVLGQAWIQAITYKFDRQYWGIEPHPPGSTTRYQPTKLTRRYVCTCPHSHSGQHLFSPAYWQ